WKKRSEKGGGSSSDEVKEEEDEFAEDIEEDVKETPQKKLNTDPSMKDEIKE
ncbi:hypothetical protein KI387_009967, partial [Taxus chinensis]